MTYPKKHISIRVPWHDTAWDGRVCKDPKSNSACLKLRRIGQNKKEDEEVLIAGKYIKDIPEDDRPPCVPERMAFMSNFDYSRTANHPYRYSSQETHQHFAPTNLCHPAYSAPAVPFFWMLKQNREELKKKYDIDIREDREPDLAFDTAWMQDKTNQKNLMNVFYDHIEPKKSLCFFYAKQAPFVENAPATKRILIGVGRVTKLCDYTEYKYNTKDMDGKIRSMLWERMVHHSIRPDFKDGFILPYHQAINYSKEKPDFDVESIAAFSPAERISEFSYASELVTHDGALSCLLSCAGSLRRIQNIPLEGPWNNCLSWIDDRCREIWKVRGAFPGLASALSAFGINLSTLMAHHIYSKVGENEDPWPFINKVFDNPREHLPKELAPQIEKTWQEVWHSLPEERKALLKLLSRFELQEKQTELVYAKEKREEAGINFSDKEILENPYILYESTRLTGEPISVWTIDKGVFPVEEIMNKHPLPEPTKLDSGTDKRRVRALMVNNLEDAVEAGSTLSSQRDIVNSISSLDIEPECKISGDFINAAKGDFIGILEETSLADGSEAFQLARMKKVRDVINSAISKRLQGKRFEIQIDWREILDGHPEIGHMNADDDLEEQARQEKTIALKEMAESRFSVLAGPAGTGKTLLLSILCNQLRNEGEEVCLLAPTGKARVRMEQATGFKGYTIAQFLAPHRFDISTGRYKLSDKPTSEVAETVIIDEASMLTEEMLAALIEHFKLVKRLILVGDSRQLPPIGAGRPFVDIIEYLNQRDEENDSEYASHKAGKGYSELTIRRRQIGEDRHDLKFADFFSDSGGDLEEEIMFGNKSDDNKYIHFIPWNSEGELQEKLIDVIVEELDLADSQDAEQFDNSLGGQHYQDSYGMCYFNIGAAEKCEEWQILTPVKVSAFGAININRLIHQKFRQSIMDSAEKESRYRKLPKPLGAEKIVYGDKVINTINTDPMSRKYRHRKCYPEQETPYIANGEIGIVVGYFLRKDMPQMKWKRDVMEVEFSSQSGHKYDYDYRDFSEEKNPALELAYALTVHKAQGSQFGTTIVVLPYPCRLLSRELLYTALTRHTERIVVLHQGDRSNLYKYSTSLNSDTATRLTNLFKPAFPIELDGRIFEKGLIHITSKDECVRSKSEVIIADRLSHFQVDYAYERPLTIGEYKKYPDFTIEDMESGKIFYWEHCGMLNQPDYKKRWEKKLDWYKSNGIIPHEEGEGKNGILIVTEESPGISVPAIDKLIRSVILGKA